MEEQTNSYQVQVSSTGPYALLLHYPSSGSRTAKSLLLLQVHLSVFTHMQIQNWGQVLAVSSLLSIPISLGKARASLLSHPVSRYLNVRLSGHKLFRKQSNRYSLSSGLQCLHTHPIQRQWSQKSAHSQHIVKCTRSSAIFRSFPLSMHFEIKLFFSAMKVCKMTVPYSRQCPESLQSQKKFLQQLESIHFLNDRMGA